MRKETNSGLGKQILTGALSLSVAAILVKIMGVIYKVPLSYILGDEGMGYFNSAYAVYGFFYVLCTAGVPKAVAVLITEANESGRGEERARIFKITLTLFLYIGLALSLGFIIFSGPLASLVGASRSRAAMLAIAPSVLFTSLSGVMRGYLNGQNNLFPVALSQLIEALGKLGLGLAFAYLSAKLGHSLPICAAFSVLGITLGSLFGCLYLYIASKKQNPRENTRQSSTLSRRKIVKRFLSIAIPISLGSSVLSLSSVIDLGIIMRGLRAIGYTEEAGAALFGNYTTLAVPMLNLVSAVLTPITVAALPTLTSLSLRADSEGFRSTLTDITRITAAIATPAALCFLLFPFTILDLLFSPGASVIGAGGLALLAPATLLLPLLTIVNTAHEARGSFKIPVISLIVGAIVKTVVGSVLIGVSEIGILAAPIGTSLSYLVSLLISVTALRQPMLLRAALLCYLRAIVVGAVAFCLPYIIVFSLDLVPYGRYGMYFVFAISLALYAIMEYPELKRLKKSRLFC